MLEIGRALFTSRPYLKISVDEIAEKAGVSKGLLYHYFGNKHAFFLAGSREGSSEFLAACTPDPSLPLAQRIKAGIKGYLDYVEARPQGYLNLFHDEIAAMPELAAVGDETREAVMKRFLETATSDRPAPATRLALRGFLRYAEAVVLDWLKQGSVDRTQLERLIVSSFVGSLLAGLRIDLGEHSVELRRIEREFEEIR